MKKKKIAEEYIDSNIKQEQELIDKKIKIYEDYFKALDKLEDARERERSREDITKQLQRLSGATDEASRKKAKDLRAELIKLDEKSKKDERKESRDALIEGLKLEKEAISTMWGELIKNFVDSGEDVGRTVGQAMALAIVDLWNAANPDNKIELTPIKTKIADPKNVEEISGSDTVVDADYRTFATQRDEDYGSRATDLTVADLRNYGISPSAYMKYADENDYTDISFEDYKEAVERDGSFTTWASLEVDKEGLESYLLDPNSSYNFSSDSEPSYDDVLAKVTEIDEKNKVKKAKDRAYEELFDMLNQYAISHDMGVLENYSIGKN